MGYGFGKLRVSGFGGFCDLGRSVEDFGACGYGSKWLEGERDRGKIGRTRKKGLEIPCSCPLLENEMK